MKGRLDFMPCSLTPLAGTLCSEQPGQPTVTSLLTYQNHSAQTSNALHSVGQLFLRLWFPKGRAHLLLCALFLCLPQPRPGSGPKQMSSCLLT